MIVITEPNKIGLKIYIDKTELMVVLESDENPRDLEVYTKFVDIKYLDSTLSTKNDWVKKIGIRIK